MRKIMCLETGEVFDSIAEATEYCGYNRLKSNIRIALTDNKRSNRAYGYTWSYIEDISAQAIIRYGLEFSKSKEEAK